MKKNYIFFTLLINVATTMLNADLNHTAMNQEIFSCIYHANSWGSPESRSGPGSSTQQTRVIRQELPKLLRQLDIQVLLDAPCGDLHWIDQIDLSFLKLYIGVDIVPDLVIDNIKNHSTSNRVFLHLDITKDELPRADVVLCRDCLAHLCFDDIWATLRNIKKSGARYLLASTYPRHMNNLDFPLSMQLHLLRYRPLNLQQEPFNLPEPLLIINEENTEGNINDKSLGLWRLSDIIIPQ